MKKIAILLTGLLIVTMVVVVGLGFVIVRQADTHYGMKKDNSVLKGKLATAEKKLRIRMEIELEYIGNEKNCKKASAIIEKELRSCINRLLDDKKPKSKSPRKLKGNDKI